jgi:ribosomal protein S1
MSKALEKTNTQQTNTEFDFDSYNDETHIPVYKDIKDELDNPTGKFTTDFLKALAMYDNKDFIPQIHVGSIVKGTILEIRSREIVIDINNKDNVFIDRKGSEERICKMLKIDQEIDVLITEISDHPFQIKGSIAELVKINVDRKMRESYDNKSPIDAFVSEIIPAGYMLNIDIDNITIEAFMPNTLADVNKLYDPNLLLGKNIKVMLETPQQDKGIYVVSRKKYLKTLIIDKVKEIKNNPKDKVYTGHVTGTREFGVFVQFEGCLTGMIHKANINEKFRDKITSIQPGTEIDFYVKDIIKGGNQIILTQILTESLWDTIRVGDVLNGKIATIKPFGALIELDYETMGLIQNVYINKNNKTISAGDKIDVIVISIIRDDRKIYLTFADDVDMVDKLTDKSNEFDKSKK